MGTYREEEVDNVHKHQDQVADSGLMVGVGCGNEADGEEVVSQHLPVVLAALLNVNDEHLLQPESPLRQHVGLHDSIDLSNGPVHPELLQVQVVRRFVVEILSWKLAF